MGISRFWTPRSRYCLITTVSFTGGRTTGLDRVAVHGLQLGQDGFEPVGAVLGVDQQPVQAGPGAELGNQRAAGAHPHPGQRAAGCARLVAQGVAEGVVGFYSKRHVMLPRGP